ncbi:MAG: formate--phosphoribosylaminoimidazolecarboxamide ligase family protein [Candidatus Bathyarchaeia archaeon]
MIGRDDVARALSKYDLGNLRIGTIGSHSALDICDGAKDEGFETVTLCQRGREKTYLRYRRIIDKVLILDKFSDMAREDVQEELRVLNVIFIANRSFSTYVGYDNIENKFLVPIFGNRRMLRSEERDAPRNQMYLLDKAGIRTPKKFRGPEEIDRLAIVKVPEAARKIERAFFYAANPHDFRVQADLRVSKGIVSLEDLRKATIEEFVVGARFNFNYFWSPIHDRLEFLGVDRRIQTDLDGVLSLPAREQLELKMVTQNIEVGHEGATLRESIVDKVYEIGEKFVRVCRDEYPPGIIGPFALQGAITKDLEICIFDVSPRVPGSPIISTTSPYTKWFFGEPMSTGRRIALEIKAARDLGRIGEVVT